MDFRSTVVGAIIIAICLVPFILMRRASNKKRKQMFFSLDKIANEHQRQISQHEMCGDFILGSDQDTDFVFFYREKSNGSSSQSVDLSKIKSCQASKGTRTIKSKAGNSSIIERVDLSFLPKDKHKPEVKFELFSVGDIQLNGELELADKWSAKINHRLQSEY